MKNKYKLRKEMALEHFFLNDTLNGVLSGGIEFPREILEVKAFNMPHKSKISIIYTHRSGYYTDLREGMRFTDRYIVDKKGNITHCGKTLFDASLESDSFYDLCKPYIDGFTRKWTMLWAEVNQDKRAII